MKEKRMSVRCIKNSFFENFAFHILQKQCLFWKWTNQLKKNDGTLVLDTTAVAATSSFGGQAVSCSIVIAGSPSVVRLSAAAGVPISFYYRSVKRIEHSRPSRYVYLGRHSIGFYYQSVKCIEHARPPRYVCLGRHFLRGGQAVGWRSFGFYSHETLELLNILNALNFLTYHSWWYGSPLRMVMAR
jgi:hypothetical protein